MSTSARVRPTVIDLFSGAGGFSLGLHAAGAKVIAAVELDDRAAETYGRNFAKLNANVAVHAGACGDMEHLDLGKVARRGDVDVLIGGPPCQGFSRVGRAKLDSLSSAGHAADRRNRLYLRFLEAAEQWQPRAVIMENVPGMLSVGGHSVADEAAKDLIARGYSAGYAVLNAVWFGVPQYRERVFLVGIRRDLSRVPSVPAATHRGPLPSGYLVPTCELFLPFTDIHHDLPVDLSRATAPAVGAQHALGDLPPLTEHLDGTPPPRGNFRVRRQYRAPAHSPYAQLMREWPELPTQDFIDDHVIRRTSRDYETFRRMAPGDRYADAVRIARARMEEEVEKLSTGDASFQLDEHRRAELERRFVPPYPLDIFVDKWRKLIPDEPSWTVPAHLAKDSYSHIHYDSSQARAISVREAARLQSFPDAFEFAGNMGDCFRQIGNAVPPLLGWAVGAHVLHVLGFASATPPVCAGDVDRRDIVHAA